VAVYGGFAGGETDLTQRDVPTNTTVLSGDLNGDDQSGGDNTENSYHVVTGGGTDVTAVLDGFTVAGGNANAGSPDNKGGGMTNNGSSPTVTHCTFSGNSAKTEGGGMFNGFSSSPTVTNCIFSGNSTSGTSSSNAGGGMNNFDSSPTVTNCTFSENTTGGNGGGMVNFESSPTVTNCAFSENTARIGGAMYNGFISNPAVINCILWSNTALNGPQIFNESSTPTIRFSDIEGSGGSGAGWTPILGSDGGGNIDSNPLFADTDLRLSANSPCIDAGDNSGVPAGIATDLDGNPRFVDDPNTADTGSGTSPIVDMGAYEFQP
jgi:hypothetical protein